MKLVLRAIIFPRSTTAASAQGHIFLGQRSKFQVGPTCFKVGPGSRSISRSRSRSNSRSRSLLKVKISYWSNFLQSCQGRKFKVKFKVKTRSRSRSRQFRQVLRPLADHLSVRYCGRQVRILRQVMFKIKHDIPVCYLAEITFSPRSNVDRSGLLLGEG